jgi:hypothetical protein
MVRYWFWSGLCIFYYANISFEDTLRYNGTLGFGHEAYTNYLNLALWFSIYLPGKSTVNKVKCQNECKIDYLLKSRLMRDFLLHEFSNQRMKMMRTLFRFTEYLP